MSRIVTTRQQYSRLLELLQEKPEITQGYSKCPKEEVTAFWQKVEEELNGLGPPTKDVSSWKKVWLDWKAYIKRKLMENKREQEATGGGQYRQHSFNEMEDQIIALTALQTSTSGVRNTISVGVPRTAEQANDETDADVSMMSQDLNLPRRTTPPQKKTSTAEILKEQLELQKSYYEDSRKHFEEQNKNFEILSAGIRRIYRAHEKMYDLKKEELEETRRHNAVNENLLREKNKIKQKMLEIELEKLQLGNENYP